MGTTVSTERSWPEVIRASVAEEWESQERHPFVRGIADGTLEPEKFRYWIRQDYVFLVDYCRVFALAAAKAAAFDTLARLVELLHKTVTVEMGLHRRLAAQFGISSTELEQERPASTTKAYADFLLRTAAIGEIAEVAAAILPCMWGFSDLAQRLASRQLPDHPHYRAWIETYANEEFAQVAAWCRTWVDDLAAEASDTTRERMREAFVTSTRYELRFWDMAWMAGEAEVLSPPGSV